MLLINILRGAVEWATSIRTMERGLEPTRNLSRPTTPSSNACLSLRTRRAAVAALIAAPTLLGEQAVAAPVAAQTVCGGHDDIIAELARINGEAPIALGLAANGTLVELLISRTGDWTILVTFPTEETCVLAVGEHWESIPADVANVDS